MDLSSCVLQLSAHVWGWPLLLFFVLVGTIAFFRLYAAPFRYLIMAWKLVFAPAMEEAGSAQMSAQQAFINTLGTNIGNGSIAGVAIAIASGGPGSIFWMMIAGFLAMALRLSEVYLGTCFIGKETFGSAKGGPMLYLTKLPGGHILSYTFATLCLGFGMITGNAMQANSIADGIKCTWSVAPLISACVLLVFIGYVLLGGASRIIAVSDKLVPFKVAVFMVAAIIVLVYNAAGIIPALSLIVRSAFGYKALAGGAIGFGLQQALRFGIARGASANEGGLGTAAVMFGTTDGKNPVKDSILSMLGVFISTHIIGLMIAVCILASGAWPSNLTGAPLSIAAFASVFGKFGGWIITFCSASFGLSVMVSYAYVARECWVFLTNGRWQYLFMLLYAGATFFGSILDLEVVWGLSDIINGSMLIINLIAILWLLNTIRQGLTEFNQQQSKK